MKSGFGIFSSLAEDEERDWAKNHRTSRDASGFSFLEFLNGLIEIQLEISLVGELRNNEMIIGVKPGNKKLKESG